MMVQAREMEVNSIRQEEEKRPEPGSRQREDRSFTIL